MAYFQSPCGGIHWISSDYSHLLPDGSVEITEDQAQTIIEALKPIPSYAQLRLAKYPSMAEYIDGIVKGDTAQTQKYISDCLAVKANYPKPEL